MMRRMLACLALLCTVTVPLSAELKYTIKLQAQDSTVQMPTPANPLLAMLGGMIVSMIAPPGGLDMTVTVGDRGVRVDYAQAYLMLPAGSAMILGPDGVGIGLDPAKKVYWKSQVGDVSALGGRQPVVNIRRTGEFATIAGVRAERAAVDVRVALPVAQGMPGFPTELTMSGDAWVTDQFKKYASLSSVLGSATGSVGLPQMANAGLLMRSVMRSELFGSKEIESVVTSIGEVTAPASLFQVPPGYAEVASPTLPMLPLGPR